MSQATSSAPAPCTHRRLLQEGGEATQGVPAAPRTLTIPPQQALSAGKASVGHEEWAPTSVTGRVTRQCHNLKELEADEATGKPEHEKAFQSSWGLTTGSAHFPTPDSLIGSTSFSSDASMLASLVSKLLGFKSKTK